MVRGREHGEPHFHLDGSDWRCVIAIGDLKLLAGDAPARALREARAWAESNRGALLSVWRRMNG